MSPLLENAKKKRSFVSKDLIVASWNDVESYFHDLEQRSITSTLDLEQWLKDRSELDSVLEEEAAWRYIRMNCDTTDVDLAKQFNIFVSEIEPEVNRLSNLLDEKFVKSRYLKELDANAYFVLQRATLNKIELFREENLPIVAELQQESQEYGVTCSKQIINYGGKDITLQQAAVYLKENDRGVRQDVYEKINNRRLEDSSALDELLDRLIKKRHQLAVNAGYLNYADYRFKELGRFDYTKRDCEAFHESVREWVIPIVRNLNKQRKERLKLDTLRPWDLDVDTENKPPLKPFETSNELLDKAISCFTEIAAEFGSFLTIMRENGHLDLGSRLGKAPGGFNYPLYESNAPFIYMNAAGTLRDVETMVHEGGHAVHSFLSCNIALVEYKGLPSEVAELASMSMELISMEHWHHYFSNADDLKRAKRSQLEGILSILPWIMVIDSFQNFLYLNPGCTPEERIVAWNKTLGSFSDGTTDWTGYEHFRNYSWQKQLHIYEVPFYYIEYGIAQLGAIAMWRNYTRDKSKTIEQYKAALSLGYSVPINTIYETAGITFDFSSRYVKELMDFVCDELNKLN